MPKFNNVQLTEETIQRTRQHFADNALACIVEVANGEVRVNDQHAYFEWQVQRYQDALNGKNDRTLTFLQRAHWLQTGEMIALLP